MKLIYWETLQNKRLEGESSLNKVIARFQEFFNQILCNSNGLLAPPDIDFIQYHQSLIVDIDHSYPEIYYDFEHSDRAGYSLFFTERNTHRLLYRCQDETIAAYALLSVYINKCVPSLKRTAEARHRVQEEIKGSRQHDRIPVVRSGKLHDRCLYPGQRRQSHASDLIQQGRGNKKRRRCGVSLYLAEMVGFEPTGRVTDQTISSRSRYDLFDTSPWHITILLYHTSPENATPMRKKIQKKRQEHESSCLFLSNIEDFSIFF